MTINDFNTNDDRDRNKRKENREELDSIRDNSKKDMEEGKSIEVKNAHASGDGSFGRNESSIPDQESRLSKDDSVY